MYVLCVFLDETLIFAYVPVFIYNTAEADKADTSVVLQQTYQALYIGNEGEIIMISNNLFHSSFPS